MHSLWLEGSARNAFSWSADPVVIPVAFSRYNALHAFQLTWIMKPSLSVCSENFVSSREWKGWNVSIPARSNCRVSRACEIIPLDSRSKDIQLTCPLFRLYYPCYSWKFLFSLHEYVVCQLCLGQTLGWIQRLETDIPIKTLYLTGEGLPEKRTPGSSVTKRK